MKLSGAAGQIELTVEDEDVGKTFRVTQPGWHEGLEGLEVQEVDRTAEPPAPFWVKPQAAGKAQGHCYEGRHTALGVLVLMDGRELSPGCSLAVINHSPTGFEWGYGGSGPAQLALALLLEEVGKEVALNLYQRFKWNVVAWLKFERWELTSQDIQEWVTQQAKKEEAKP